MSIASSTQPSLRARMIPRFPANVLAGNGMVITKNGGTYIFATTPYANIPLSALANVPTDTLLGRDTIGSGAPEVLTVSGGLGMTGAGGLQMVMGQRLRMLPIVFFQNGATLTAGIKADVSVPFTCIIRRVTLLADAAGTIQIDIWRDSYANYPPVVGDSITAAAKPILSGTSKDQDSTLTGWNTNITALDTLRFNVDSSPTPATVTRVTLCLDVEVVG